MHAVESYKTGTWQDAMQMEKKGELKEAAGLYRLLHKQSPENLKILNRLIIVYRKLKDVVNEIRYIDAAIKIYEQYYALGKHADKKTVTISKQLNFLLGHTNKKGGPVFKPPELTRLDLRKKRLQLKR